MSDRYACPQIAEMFSRRVQLLHWVAIWNAGLQALNKPYPLGVNIPQLGEVADKLEKEFGHDIAAGAEAYRQMLAFALPESARFVHYGYCSSDIADATTFRTIRAVDLELTSMADLLNFDLHVLATAHTDTARAARTHGQLAVPDTFGRQVMVWSARLRQATSQMQDRARHIGTVAFLGPVGNGSPFTDQQRVRIQGTLGLPFPNHETDQAASRQGISAWLHAVAALVGACEHIAMQVRLGSQSGIEELSEPSGVTDYHGSSSMPHKANPTRSERICGLVRVVRALSNAHQEGASAWWGQHSLEHSSIERVVLPQVSELAGFILNETRAIVQGLQVNMRRMRETGWGLPNSFAEKNALVREGADGEDAWREINGR